MLGLRKNFSEENNVGSADFSYKINAVAGVYVVNVRLQSGELIVKKVILK